MLGILGSKETILWCLLCLCVGIISGSSHEDMPKKCCTKAKECMECVVGSCSDPDDIYIERFSLSCCGSDVANLTQACRQLCKNFSGINAVRYNSKTNESEDLCPAGYMLKECEEDYYINCTAIMCTHFVLKVVFLQQCHGECKNLATDSSITSSTKSLNETTKSTEDPSDKALINSDSRSTTSSTKSSNEMINSTKDPPDEAIINSDSRSITSSTKSLNETTNSTKDPPDKVLINSAGTTNTTVSTDDVKSETTTPANPATTQYVRNVVIVIVELAIVLAIVFAFACWCYTNSNKSDYKDGVHPEEENTHLQVYVPEDTKSTDMKEDDLSEIENLNGDEDIISMSDEPAEPNLQCL